MSNLARFPKSGFILPCPDGQQLAAIPGSTRDGRPTIRFCTGSEDIGHTEAGVPLDQLEEVIAGLREIARQQDGIEPRPSAKDRDRAYRQAYPMSQRFPGDSPAMRAAAIATCRAFVGVGEKCARCAVPIDEHEADR
ncbi:hypothetical protein ACFXPI_11120 [Streptomyces sp. NPDC059104]|uniref:hypothetical protein n=1 Tax=Streptomyces sp. NPDC059104 TaxID=3346729 RepID=UPI003695D955